MAWGCSEVAGTDSGSPPVCPSLPPQHLASSPSESKIVCRRRLARQWNKDIKRQRQLPPQEGRLSVEIYQIPRVHDSKLWRSWMLCVALQTQSPKISMTLNSHTEYLYTFSSLLFTWSIPETWSRRGSETVSSPSEAPRVGPLQLSILTWFLALLLRPLGSFTHGPYSTLRLPLLTWWYPLFPYW